MKQNHDPHITVLRFEAFRLDRRGGLSRNSENGGWEPVEVGSRALDLLHALLEHRGELVTKDKLMNAAWPGVVVEDANLTMQISALRRVLDAGRASGSCIRTITGRGYYFLPEVAVQVADDGAVTAGQGTPDASEPPRLSIVVLPFVNLSDDRDQQFLADGITVDLTTDLSRITDAFVISCNTAFAYRNKPVETRQIARELGVRFVLEGSIQRSGDRLRVNAQLIDGFMDRHMWAERFDREIGDLMVLQDEVVRCIAVALSLELNKAEAVRARGQSDVLDCLIRGRSIALQTLSPKNYSERIRLYEQACAIDSRSVEAMSRLASTLVGRVLDLMTTAPAADIARAEGLVERALALSPLNPMAHFALGHVRRVQGRFEDAIPAYEMALAANRNWVTAMSLIGASKLHVGFIEEAMPAQERAIRLSPRDPDLWIFYFYIGLAHFLRFRTEDAILWFHRSRTCSPEHPLPKAYLAAAYALQGDRSRAQAHLADARRVSGGRFASIARIRASAGARFGVQEVVALFEATFLAGLKLAGVPDMG